MRYAVSCGVPTNWLFLHATMIIKAAKRDRSLGPSQPLTRLQQNSLSTGHSTKGHCTHMQTTTCKWWLLPKRPTSRQTEMDSWTILLGWSLRSSTPQCFKLSTGCKHTHAPTALVSATLRCVFSAGHTWVAGPQVFIAVSSITKNMPAVKYPCYSGCGASVGCSWW